MPCACPTLGHVNTIILRRGVDGKSYPDRPLTPVERARAHRLAHELVHTARLSVRAAQKVMLEKYGLRRAVGTIQRDLTLWECPHCPDLNT